MSTPLQRAVTRFQYEVWDHRDIIDPNNNNDWHDMAKGFLLACKVHPDELTWTLLSDLANGHFERYLKPQPTVDEWVEEFITSCPEVLAVRLGNGMGPLGHQTQGPWLSTVGTNGDLTHLPWDIKFTVPKYVIEWALNNIPHGEFREWTRT